MFNLFKKKEPSEFDAKAKDLRKAIGKKDDTSISQSLQLLRDLSVLDSAKLSELILGECQKGRNGFVSGLTSKLIVMSDDVFSDSILKAIIDHEFRFGDGTDQRSAALLLRKYKSHTDLLARYKLVYVKDRKTQQMIDELVK